MSRLPLPPMTVGDLVAELQRFDPAARLVGSVGGHLVPRVWVGVIGSPPDYAPAVAIADRERFAGRLPDMLLERPRRRGQ